MRRAVDDQALLALLQVDETASWDEVRRAFRAAVRSTHPDLNAGDPDAERRLKALNAAWETVNTPSKWAAYSGRPATRGGAGGASRVRDAAAVPTIGRLRVKRAQRGAAGLVSWNLELDGAVLATVENGGTAVLDAEPGRHSLRIFYGSHSSLPLRVAVERGEELLLGCRQHESLRVSLFSPKRSLLLELLDRRRFDA